MEKSFETEKSRPALPESTIVLLKKSLGLVWFFLMFLKDVSLHLFDQKYSKIVKYFYNLE